MIAQEYYQQTQCAIGESRLVIASTISFNEVDRNECYMRGVLTLFNECELHIAEYVVTQPAIKRDKYRNHLQKTDGTLVSRWDNVPHHSHIAIFPDHRHDRDGTIHPSPAIGIPEVLQAIIPSVFP
jgi:hypothetical protein